MPTVHPDDPAAADLTSIYASVWQDVENAVERRDEILTRFGFRDPYEGWLSGGVDLLRALPEWVQEGHHGGPDDDLLAQNWIELLARDCASRYAISPRTADILAKLHTLRADRLRSWRARFNAKTLIGVAVAAIGVAATQAPKESFEALGWKSAYGWYRLGLLVALLAVVLLVVRAAVQTRREWMKLERTLHIMEAVLTFCQSDSVEGSR